MGPFLGSFGSTDNCLFLTLPRLLKKLSCSDMLKEAPGASPPNPFFENHPVATAHFVMKRKSGSLHFEPANHSAYPVKKRFQNLLGECIGMHDTRPLKALKSYELRQQV